MSKNFTLILVIVFLVGMLSGALIPKASAQTRNFHLYGSASLGWGFASNSITSPGPSIQVYQGETVNLTLTSQDGLAHQFFVDYNNNSVADSGEPSSVTFTGTITYSFIADTLGNFKYRCTFHPTVMLGNLKVTIPGDINGDGIVDISDAALIGVNWQKTVPPAPVLADFNGDGIIDISDAAIVGIHWQQLA
jgi:plastocyanin